MFDDTIVACICVLNRSNHIVSDIRKSIISKMIDLTDLFILQDAYKHGWRYKGVNWMNKPIFRPPNTFSCNVWCVDAVTMFNGREDISVPHWIYDDNVRTTGSW